MVGKYVHTNTKQTASGQILYNLQHLLFGDFAIAFFLFLNTVLQVRRAASMNLRQACEYRFTE
jgi:hypothetical protein